MMTYDFGTINLKPRSHCMIIIFLSWRYITGLNCNNHSIQSFNGRAHNLIRFSDEIDLKGQI